MIQREKIQAILDEILAEETHLFLVELNINNGTDIEILMDSDNGITIGECKQISRKVERWLEENELDSSLFVASPGLDKPLTQFRQFRKNVGRTLEIKLKDNTKMLKAELSEADEEKIIVSWKERVPKEIGKGKRTVDFTKSIQYTEIELAKVVISFK
ncbi:MAG: ribosome assembly cofactor RimP [Flavobacteriales bacterium]